MKFKQNTVGKDFVVGDIHGCFTKLQQALEALNFNANTDRLFSVGDLVDRGPESEQCIDWLAKPWFHAVRGNHEQMAIDAYDGFFDSADYRYNGGGWFLDLSKEEQGYYTTAFQKLPFWMEIETPNGLVGIVHAECPLDWNFTKENHQSIYDQILLWGRSKISIWDKRPIENVWRVYSGHTPIKTKLILGNQHFIDTGAVFGGVFAIEQIN